MAMRRKNTKPASSLHEEEEVVHLIDDDETPKQTSHLRGALNFWLASSDRGSLIGVLTSGFVIGLNLFLFNLLLGSANEKVAAELRETTQVPGLTEQHAAVKAVPIPTTLRKPPETKEVKKREKVKSGFVAPPSVPYKFEGNGLSPLEPIDFDQYTVRINTWKRPEQLMASVEHHSSCPGVAQIQVVWMDKEEEPPKELEKFDKVVVERHEENTLNERFRVLLKPKTRGILSVDDDLLRPCKSIDSAFFKWIKYPDRMVGFEVRTHNEETDGSWSYGVNSVADRENMYSMALTRYSFLHVDYMQMYMNDLPKEILNDVAESFNCDDIAMSFFMSSKTQGRPPLLADVWAIQTKVDMWAEKKISRTNTYDGKRDECVDKYAKLLNLKDGDSKLDKAEYISLRLVNKWFDAGERPSWEGLTHPISDREKEFNEMVTDMRWTKRSELDSKIRRMRYIAGIPAYNRGLIENTDKWRERWNKENIKESED